MKPVAMISLLSRLLTLGFIAGAAGILALITWQLYLPPAPPSVMPQGVLPRQETAHFTRGLFGAGATKAREHGPHEALPPTALPLTLTGLLASDDVQRRLAVVLYQGKQASYREGDALPVSGVRVARIEGDGVVLDEPGGPKRLSWPRRATGATGARVSGEVRQQLVQRPQDIADFISVAPVREDDKLRGYRINPGRKPALFNTLGFEPGDLAVAINGADLSDSQQAQQILLQLPQLRALTVTVERDGQRHDISVSLDEGAL